MIVICDDEKRSVDSLAEELQASGYIPSIYTKVDEALRFIKENLDTIELIILDVAMPPGSTFENENTDEGMQTGVFVYERIRGMAQQLPILIYTNVSDHFIFEKFQDELHCKLLMKADYLPFELVEEVKAMLKSN